MPLNSGPNLQTGSTGFHQHVSKRIAQTFPNGTATATYTNENPEPPFFYQWRNANDQIIGTDATITGLVAGNYSVYGADINNLETIDSARVTITQPPPLTASATHTNVTSAGGSDGTATASSGGGTPGYSYSWAPTGGTAATATGLTAGTYAVTVTDANGCSTNATVIIGVGAVPVPVPAVVKPVPTLSEWGVILMGLMLAGFAALRLRRAP